MGVSQSRSSGDDHVRDLANDIAKLGARRDSPEGKYFGAGESDLGVGEAVEALEKAAKETDMVAEKAKEDLKNTLGQEELKVPDGNETIAEGARGHVEGAFGAWGGGILGGDDVEPTKAYELMGNLRKGTTGKLTDSSAALHVALQKQIDHVNLVMTTLKSLQVKMTESVGADDRSMSEATAKLASMLMAEGERQLGILSNMLNTPLKKFEKDLVDVLSKDGEYDEVIKSLRSGYDEGEWGDLVAKVMRGVPDMSSITSEAREAAETLGANYDDLMRSRENIKQALAKAIPNASDKDLSKVIEAGRKLELGFKYKGKTGAGATGGAVGGLPSVEKRLKKQGKTRKAVLLAFADSSKILYKRILQSVFDMSKKLGTTIPLNDELSRFIQTFDEMGTIYKEGIEYALTGYYTHANAVEERERFVGQLDAVILSLAPLSSSPGADSFNKIKQSLLDLRKLIDTYNDRFSKGPSDSIQRKFQFATGQGEGHDDMVEGARKAVGSGLDDLGAHSAAYFGKNSSGGASGGGSHNVALTLKNVSRTLKHFYSVAKMRANLKKVASESKEYNKDYEKVVGTAMGKKVDEFKKDFNQFKAKLEGDDTKNYKGYDLSSMYEYIGNKIKTLGRNAKTSPAGVCNDTKYSEYGKETILKVKKEMTDAKIDLIRAIQAIDAHLMHFSDAVAASPDDIKEVSRILDSVDIVAEWFNHRSGDSIAALFEFSPWMLHNGEPLDSPLACGREKIVDMKECRLTGTLGKSHYYEEVARVEQLGAAGWQPRAPGVGHHWTTDKRGHPGNPYLVMSPDRCLRARKFAKKTCDRVHALKNIVNAFSYLGDKFGAFEVKGGGSISGSVFMDPQQIHDCLQRYLYTSAYVMGWDSDNKWEDGGVDDKSVYSVLRADGGGMIGPNLDHSGSTGASTDCSISNICGRVKSINRQSSADARMDYLNKIVNYLLISVNTLRTSTEDSRLVRLELIKRINALNTFASDAHAEIMRIATSVKALERSPGVIASSPLSFHDIRRSERARRRAAILRKKVAISSIDSSSSDSGSSSSSDSGSSSSSDSGSSSSSDIDPFSKYDMNLEGVINLINKSGNSPEEIDKSLYDTVGIRDGMADVFKSTFFIKVPDLKNNNKKLYSHTLNTFTKEEILGDLEFMILGSSEGGALTSVTPGASYNVMLSYEPTDAKTKPEERNWEMYRTFGCAMNSVRKYPGKNNDSDESTIGTVGGWHDEFGETDQLFIAAVKAMVAKVFTVSGIYNMFNYKTQTDHTMNSARFVLGGVESEASGQEPSDMPHIYDDAVELYIRLPLIAEFYKDIFSLDEFNQSWGLTKSGDDNIAVTLIPEMDHIWNGLMRTVFDQPQGSAGLMTKNYASHLIREINKIYSHYKNKGVSSNVGMVTMVVNDLVADVNSRFGLMKKFEVDKYVENERLLKKKITMGEDDGELHDFDTLRGGESVSHSSIAPSDRYSSTIYKGDDSTETLFDIKFMDVIKKFRDRIDRRVRDAVYGEEFSAQEMLGRAHKVPNFHDQARVTKSSLKASVSGKDRFDTVYATIAGIDAMANVSDETYVMFHETVVAPLMVLASVARSLEEFEKTVWENCAGSAYRVIVDNNNDDRAVITALLNEKIIPSKCKLDNSRQVLRLDSYVIRDNTSLITVVASPKNTPKLKALALVWTEKCFKQLTQLLIAHASDTGGMVEIATHGKKLTIDHSKLQQYCEDTLAHVRKSIHKFRGSVSADVLKLYESGMGDDTCSTSIRYIQHNLIDNMFNSQSDGGLTRAVKEITDSFLLFNGVSPIDNKQAFDKALDGNDAGKNYCGLSYDSVLSELSYYHSPSMHEGNQAGSMYLNDIGASDANVMSEGRRFFSPATPGNINQVFTQNDLLNQVVMSKSESKSGASRVYESTRHLARWGLYSQPSQGDSGYRGDRPDRRHANSDGTANMGAKLSDGGEGLMVRFNEVLARYLEQFWDQSEGKIYKPVVADFANGAAHRAVMESRGWPDFVSPNLGASVNARMTALISTWPMMSDVGKNIGFLPNDMCYGKENWVYRLARACWDIDNMVTHSGQPRGYNGKNTLRLLSEKYSNSPTNIVTNTTNNDRLVKITIGTVLKRLSSSWGLNKKGLVDDLRASFDDALKKYELLNLYNSDIDRVKVSLTKFRNAVIQDAVEHGIVGCIFGLMNSHTTPGSPEKAWDESAHEIFDKLQQELESVSDKLSESPSEVSNFVALDDPKVYFANACDKFGNPDEIVFASLAKCMKTMLTEQNRTGQPAHVITNMADVPIRMKENFKANLPGFIKHFGMINESANILKKILKMGIPVERYLRNSTELQQGQKTTEVNVQGELFGIAFGKGNKLLEIQKDSVEYHRYILDKITTSCQSVIKCATTVLGELSDNPLFLETGENSISDYRNANNVAPFMPLSSALMGLKALNPDDRGEASARDPNSLMPLHSPGSRDFEFNYGTRLVLGRPRVLPLLDHMPGVRALTEKYNLVCHTENKVSLDTMSGLVAKLVPLLRWTSDTRVFAPLVGGFVPACEIDLVGSNTKDDCGRPYCLEASMDNIVGLTSDSDKQGSIKTIVNCFKGRDLAGNRMLSRENAQIYNIIDLNINPININALRREIPLINAMNYAYTFDSFCKDIIGNYKLFDDGKALPPVSIGAPSDFTLSQSTAMLTMMVNPYTATNFTNPALVEVVAKMFSDTFQRDLGARNDRFVVEQILNKSLMLNSVNNRSKYQKDMKSIGSYKSIVRDDMRIIRGAKTPNNRKTLKDILEGSAYLAELSSMRFDTKFIRNLLFISSAHRLMRAKIQTEMVKIPFPVASGVKVTNRKITDNHPWETWEDNHFE